MTTDTLPKTPLRLLTATEAAQLLNVSPRWVYRKALSGDLPFVHLGGSARSPLRVDPEDLTAWLQNLKKSNGIEQPTEQQLCR